jgi:hypothetical protein
MVFAIVLASKDPNHKMQLKMFAGDAGQALDIAKEMVVEHLRTIIPRCMFGDSEAKYNDYCNRIKESRLVTFCTVLNEIKKSMNSEGQLEYDFECDFDGQNG